MNPGATGLNASSSTQYPVTKFAGVGGIRFGMTTSEQPAMRFDFGRTSGLLLIQLAPGEFSLILAGRFYNTTLLATRIYPEWSITVDNVLLELRWLPYTPQAYAANTWMHLRFGDRVVFADFNRRFWECYWGASEHARLLQERLDLVTHASPSNFTRYCRQYLGRDYFDNLQESDDEGEGKRSTSEDESQVEVEAQ